MDMKNKSNAGYRRQSGFSLLELMFVLVIVMLIAGMTIPKVIRIVQNIRTAGDAQSLNGIILLAKMRAASDFAQARVHADLNTNTYWVELLPAGSGTWSPEGGGTQYLAKNVAFGYGSITSPPSNTQSALGQAPTCSGVSGTACITFNSRGIPVDSSNSPTGNDAIYVTDGKTVSGVTVSGTGLTRVWHSEATTADWKQR